MRVRVAPGRMKTWEGSVIEAVRASVLAAGAVPVAMQYPDAPVTAVEGRDGSRTAGTPEGDRGGTPPSFPCGHRAWTAASAPAGREAGAEDPGGSSDREPPATRNERDHVDEPP